MKEKEIVFETNLIEYLVRTSFQTVVTSLSDKEGENPLYYGSGFMALYKENCFFVTADHVIHPTDHDKGERTNTEYIVSVFNNLRAPVDYLSTIVTPLGGFYYGEMFDISKPKDMPVLVDIAVCKMKKIHFQYPFVTDKVTCGELIIEADQTKFPITEDKLILPTENHKYFIYGKIKHKMKGVSLYREDTLKGDLLYIVETGGYYLFNSPTVIDDKYEWEGLSGSPVIDEKGNCVGVLCSVNEGTNSVWVMPLNKVKLLMDIAIMEDKIETLNNNIGTEK